MMFHYKPTSGTGYPQFLEPPKNGLLKKKKTITRVEGLSALTKVQMSLTKPCPRHPILVLTNTQQQHGENHEDHQEDTKGRSKKLVPQHEQRATFGKKDLSVFGKAIQLQMYCIHGNKTSDKLYL